MVKLGKQRRQIQFLQARPSLEVGIAARQPLNFADGTITREVGDKRFWAHLLCVSSGI